MNYQQKSLNKIDNWLNALIYEEGGKMNAGSLRTIELIRKEAENVLRHESLSKVQVDYYEDKIEMLQRLIAERDKTIANFNEPIKDEELKTANEFLYESGIDTMSMQDDFNCQLFYAMERYAEQYAASKLNNSAGVWIKASERLPEKENDYFIINNGYKSVASFIKGDGFYRMGDRESRVSKWLDESKLNNTIEDKWISVEDGNLPQEKQRCLVFNSISVEPAVFERDEFYRYPNSINGDRCALYHFDKSKVTHWQYLPEAPKK